MILSALIKMRLFLPVAASKRWMQVLVACSAAALTVGIIVEYSDCLSCLLRQYDDAYITFRYARNLALGLGLVFNRGEATDSASSFLYTVVLAFFYRIGFSDLRAVSLVLGISAAAATSAVIALICLERTRRPFFSLAVAVTTGGHGLLKGWAVSGMETLFFTGLVIFAVYRLFVLRAFGWLETCLICAIVLARFEGLLLAGAWAVLGVAHFVRGAANQRKILLAQASVVGSVLGFFLLFKWCTYATLIPHAFALKQITVMYAPKPQALWGVWHSLAFTLLVFAAVGLFTLPRTLESLAFAGYCMLSVASVLLGPWADWARYSVHLLPVSAALASVPLSRLWRDLPPLALGGCVLLGMDTRESLKQLNASATIGQGHAECREQVGRFLEDHLEPGTLVVSADLGAIAYTAASMQFIDTVGLTSKDILSAREHGLSSEPVLFARKPTVIADTCGGDCAEPQRFSASGWLSGESFWRTQMPDHEHYFSHLHGGRVLVKCKSLDGLSFAATQFTFR